MSSILSAPIAQATPAAPKVIEPTVGRMVWFWPDRNYKEQAGAQPYSAQVCYVHNVRCVNVAGYDPNGAPFTRTSLQLRQPDDPLPQGEFVEWMPFQVANPR